MKPKFAKSYVLGEGYPFCDIYGTITFMDSPLDEAKDFPNEKSIKFPRRILKKDCPKYRLILERVDKK